MKINKYVQYINLIGLSVYIRFAEGLSDIIISSDRHTGSCLPLCLLLLYIFFFCGEESVNIEFLIDWFLPLSFLSSMHTCIFISFCYVQVLLFTEYCDE